MSRRSNVFGDGSMETSRNAIANQLLPFFAMFFFALLSYPFDIAILFSIHYPFDFVHTIQGLLTRTPELVTKGQSGTGYLFLQ